MKPIYLDLNDFPQLASLPTLSEVTLKIEGKVVMKMVGGIENSIQIAPEEIEVLPEEQAPVNPGEAMKAFYDAIQTKQTFAG